LWKYLGKIIARLILKGENMSLMTEALDRISTYCYLREPNKSREEVERQLSFFPFNLSEEVYEYYQWVGAPTGNPRPDDWDLSNDTSTYNCVLERFIRGAEDLIHFLSLEEAEKFYPNYPGNTDINELKGLPFVSYENGILVIAGSETQLEACPVLQREGRDKLWFPSLTNMMLAIADSIEAIGTLLPGDYSEDGNFLDEREARERWETMAAIARKYGSPKGIIVTN
jgi:hypothetical protein